jgi:hypothetical protein
MTKPTKVQKGCCLTCRHFREDAVHVNLYFCYNLDSDHYGHALEGIHPACAAYEYDGEEGNDGRVAQD